MSQRVLIIGATGILGEPVAHLLQQAGFSVRVMSRRIEPLRAKFPEPFELVSGDAMNRADVEKALAGCDAVHISIDHDQEDECITQVVEAARSQRLERITYVSGTTVCEENRWFGLVDRKLKSEEAIRASGIAFTIFCPGWFMEMLGHFIRGGRAVMFGHPTRRWHFVSCADFARMVTEAYRRPEAVNKRFYIHGPEALTVVEALRAYCAVLHPEIRSIRHLPVWLMRLVAWFTRNEAMRRGLTMVGYLESVGERGDPTEANALLGAPRMTLEQWLRRRKPVWEGGE